MKKTLTILLVLLSVSSFAQELKSTKVNVFKNGTFYIVKEGTVNPKNGILSLPLKITPLMGTFWLNTSKDVKISKVTFITDTLKSKTKVQNIPEAVFANKGKKIKIGYQTNDKTYKEVSGTLQDYFKSSGMIKIKSTDGKTVYTNISNIVDFTVDDTPSDYMETDSLTKICKVEFAKNTESTFLKMVYMHSGIQWIPSYNIKLINEKELQLEMKALVENYAEDIVDADLTLTVGNPQMFYGYNTDPSFLDYLTSVSGLYTANKYGYYNNIAQTNSFQVQATDATTSGSTYSYDNYNDYGQYTTEGEKDNDLYLYKIGKATLLKNSKTSYQIFSNTIPYKDVYEVDVYDFINYSYNRYITNDPDKKFDVYHSFKLTNTTSTPFTTAPVMVLSEDLQPLAQDQLKYTPVDGTISVQLSRASDVIIKNSEEEVSKTETTKKYGGETYNKVIIKGTINVENLQEKKITLSVNKNLTADVIEVSDSGKIKKTGKYYNLNPYTEINWEIPLNSKDKKTITYQYEVWVRTK
jgi:hypothetical protein